MPYFHRLSDGNIITAGSENGKLFWLLNEKIPDVANNLTTTNPGYYLDARQGKILTNKITAIDEKRKKHGWIKELEKVTTTKKTYTLNSGSFSQYLDFDICITSNGWHSVSGVSNTAFCVAGRKMMVSCIYNLTQYYINVEFAYLTDTTFSAQIISSGSDSTFNNNASIYIIGKTPV